jgi:hypothetical protein
MGGNHAGTFIHSQKHDESDDTGTNDKAAARKTGGNRQGAEIIFGFMRGSFVKVYDRASLIFLGVRELVHGISDT